MGHDAIEIFSCHIAVTVEVRLWEDLLHFVVSQVFAELEGHMFELLGVDLSLNKMILTFLSWSKEKNTFSICFLEWAVPSLPVASFKNSPKFKPSGCSPSREFMMLYTSLLALANPRLTKACLSSPASTSPLPSVSKMLKAALTSLTSSIGACSQT